MKTKKYLLSFSFGLGLGTTTIHTSDPLGLVMKIRAEGHNLEHVTIKSASDKEHSVDEQGFYIQDASEVVWPIL